MDLTLRRIAEFIGADASGLSDAESSAHGYSIDSRTIQPGELFFAVIGERLDGHDYVGAAFERGALAAVVSKERAAALGHPEKLLAVDDTLVALQTLAHAVRMLWAKPLIAITGSAGKTTTKEITAHVLAQKFKVLKSQGNLNNHFGLPLQLLKLKPQHEVAVFEMGMSHAGEIEALAKIAKPDTGAVTCVAPVHLESFASVADIARAKYELIQSLPRDGTAVLNADDPFVSQFGRDFHGKVVTFGIDSASRCDVWAEAIESRGESGTGFVLATNGDKTQVRFPLLGKHNVMNALAASAVALQQGMSVNEIGRALATAKPADKRGETLHLASATIINDCYNSNPTALKAMMDVLRAMPGKRHILVAGEMLELGPTGPQLHHECGVYAKGKADWLIGVRGLARQIVEGAASVGVKAEFAETPQAAAELLAGELQSGDVVLMKASRGVRLETALEALQHRLGADQRKTV
jgi:UDP-N-acetylmuramoyl-tripeptide--D-alanyl-D-alanine ligase